MWVADVPLIAGIANLPGAALAASAAVQHGAHPRGTLGLGAALTRPLAELLALKRAGGCCPTHCWQLGIVLRPAEVL